MEKELTSKILDMIQAFQSIVAGKSVGEIRLGSSIEEFQGALEDAQIWDASKQITLQNAIRDSSSGVLFQFNSSGQKILYLQSGGLELHFNSDGVLFNILIWGNSPGFLWEGVGVGDSLQLIENKTHLFYDEGEEVHYSLNDLAKGISFYAEECSLDESPNQKIRGISIHDWSLK